MNNSMDAALKHAQNRATYLHKCGHSYIIHISLKELGISSDQSGFLYSKNAIKLLKENRSATLTNGIYLAVGLIDDPISSEKQVEQAIRCVIRKAWNNRDAEIWECYFPIGRVGRTECPTNREFLMAVVDFVELWEGFCEEVNYGKVL